MRSLRPDARQLGRLQELTDAALGHLELEQLLGALLERTRTLLSVDTCAILLLDAESNELVPRAAVGIEEKIGRGASIPLGKGFAGRVAAERRPVVLRDVDHADVMNPLLREEGIRSLLGVPLVVDGDVVGVLHVGSVDRRDFAPNEIELLQLAADRAAVAIVHARVFEAERAARAKLERVQAVTDIALAHLDLDELLPVLLPRIRDILSTDTCALLLLDEEHDELVARAAVGIEEEVEHGVRIPLGKGFAGRVAATGLRLRCDCDRRRARCRVALRYAGGAPPDRLRAGRPALAPARSAPRPVSARLEADPRLAEADRAPARAGQDRPRRSATGDAARARRAGRPCSDCRPARTRPGRLEPARQRGPARASTDRPGGGAARPPHPDLSGRPRRGSSRRRAAETLRAVRARGRRAGERARPRHRSRVRTGPRRRPRLRRRGRRRPLRGRDPSRRSVLTKAALRDRGGRRRRLAGTVRPWRPWPTSTSWRWRCRRRRRRSPRTAGPP